MPVIWYRPDLPLTVQQSYVLTSLFKSTVTEQIGKRKKLFVFSSSLFGCVVLFPSFSQPWTPENLLFFFPREKWESFQLKANPSSSPSVPLALISLLTSKEMIVGFFLFVFLNSSSGVYGEGWKKSTIEKGLFFKKNLYFRCVLTTIAPTLSPKVPYRAPSHCRG